MSQKTISKSSRSVIRNADFNQRYVYMLDSQNPETVLSNELRLFFEMIGYSEIFPNFDRLRVGVVHPFAILLSQEILEQPKSTNVFPSVTVADSSATEDQTTLGDELTSLVFTSQHIAALDGYRQAKEVFVSSTGWQKITDAVSTVGHIIGVKKTYSTRHTMDFNIWSENKDITSFLFDMVCHFMVQKRIDIHQKHNIDITQLSGRRTGDINLDFGMLLYGANVSVNVVMDHEAVLFDTMVRKIEDIDVKTLPQFFTTQGGDDG